MKAKRATFFTLVVGLLAICSPLFAHHGSVAYDNTKLVTLKQATVTKVNWANPHVLVLFDAKDDKGNLVHWVVEAGSPSAVSTQGWTNTTIQPGDVITAYLYQVRTGRPVGRLGQIVLADGKTFGTKELVGDHPVNCDQETINGGNEAAACRPDGRKTNNKE
jgi:Family of unknown function (DUF6152)